MARSRPRRFIAALSAMLVVVLLFFGGLAAVMEPNRAVSWVGTYLIPIAAILGGVFVILLLLVGLAKRFPKGHHFREDPF